MADQEGITEATVDITFTKDQAIMMLILIDEAKVKYGNRHRDIIDIVREEFKEAIIYLQEEDDALIKGVQLTPFQKYHQFVKKFWELTAPIFQNDGKLGAYTTSKLEEIINDAKGLLDNE